MKKLVFSILAVFIAAVFCGCGNLDIRCSINNGSVAEMEITFKMDYNELSDDEYSIAANALDDLSVYWRNSLGYEVEEIYDGLFYGVTIKKTERCQNKEEAVNELLEMMGADGSPFSKVEGGYVSSFLKEYVNISAAVDLTQLIDYDYVDSLPGSERDYIYENLDKFSGNVIFDIDGKIVEHNGTVDKGTVVADISLDSPAEIYSLVEMPNAKNQTAFDTLQNEAAQHEKIKNSYLMYMLLAAGLLFLLVLAMIAALLVKKSRAEKSKNEGESDAEVTVTEETQSEQAQPQPSEEDKQ